jgi:hypothetical protein
MKKFLLLSVMCLCACKDPPQHYDVRLMDGTPGYRLDCDNTQFTFEECKAEAESICSHKGANLQYFPTNSRNAFVRCEPK